MSIAYEVMDEGVERDIPSMVEDVRRQDWTVRTLLLSNEAEGKKASP
jgi:hypothetical protein